MKLNFFVKEQQLSCVDTPVILSGTINYLCAKFIFRSADWAGVNSKWAHFRRGDEVFDMRLDEDNCIKQEAGLSLSEGKWDVYLHGDHIVDGEVTQRITTDTCSFEIAPCGMLEGEPLPPVAPSAAEQIEALAAEAKYIAEKVRQDADNGAFIGPVGPRGPQGPVGPVGPTGPKGEPGLDGVQIDDNLPTKTTTYSGLKIERMVEGKIKKFFTNNLGETQLTDSDDGVMRNLRIFGKSVQEGEPSPENPQEIESAENIEVKITGKNLIDLNNLSYTSNDGLTTIMNEDGSLTINGEPTKNYSQVVNTNITGLLAEGDYYIRGGERKEGALYAQITITMNDGSQQHLYNTTFKITGNEKSVRFIIQTLSNDLTPVNNYTIYPMLNIGTEPLPFEPYKEQAVTIPHTLRGLPVSSSGNYTDKNGQQWICDEIDVERGVLVQRIGVFVPTAENTGSGVAFVEPTEENKFLRINYWSINDAVCNSKMLCNRFETHPLSNNSIKDYVETHIQTHYMIFRTTAASTREEWIDFIENNPVTAIYILAVPIETPLSADELEIYKALSTNYGGTNIFFSSENGIEPSINFDYPCAIDSFVEYIKEQTGDTRNFIYNINQRVTDEEYLSALAYVNSEYAAALLELEV